MKNKTLYIKNIIPFMSFAVTYVLLFVALILTIRYSALNPVLYFTLFGLIFVLILLFGVVSYEGIFENKPKLKMVGVIALSLISLILAFGVYYVTRVNSSINNVIVDPNQSTVLETSFVVYDTDKYESIKDLSDLRLGVLSNSDAADRNTHVKAEIEKQSININYVEYLSYNEMLLGLFSKEIDVASLPSDYFNQFSDYEGYKEYLDKTTIVDSFSFEVENTLEQVDIDVTKEPFSLLIMGNDGGRTDSLILATFNPIKLSVTMTSIPRDSYVPIACYPNQQKDKIGHAFSVSRDCALETVENLFDIDISYYIEVNFKGVVEIVDALDKIWIVSPVEFVGQNSDEERGHYTVKVFKGGQFATGEQALAFARERHAMPGGDYQRQENQQSVIRSIIDRTLELRDINKALNVMDAAGNNVKTNLSLNQIIAIFNQLLGAINKTGLASGDMLDIMGSRVMGYSSYTYNETLQLPLWISKPYEGSINDLRTFVLNNLLINDTTPPSIGIQFDSRQVFYEEDYFAKTYNEKEIHEQLPDFMPTMSNNNWTLENAREWANKRRVNLIIEEIRFGNSLYTANVIHNYIVGQSIKYGVKTSNFTSLNIKVIKHELDCTIDANKEYEECKYKLPDWQDYGGSMTTVSFAKSWFKDLGLTPNIKYIIIPETDPTYKKEKIGYIIKQDPISWADVRSLTEITFTVMDPNFQIPIPNTSSIWTETDAKTWVKNNLESENNYVISYSPTTDPTQFGKLKSVTPTIVTKVNHIGYQDILKLEFYIEGFKLKNYVGGTKTALQVDCDAVLFQCTYTNVVATVTDTVGNIKSQSISFDTLKSKTEWTTTVITFEVFVSSGS